MRPAVTAMVDQATAAADHAAYALQLATQAGRGVLSYEVPTGASAVVLSRFTLGLAGGRITPCAHLSATRPEPVFWAAWRPGRVRCAPCVVVTAKAIKGTAEEYRCDHCRRTTKRLTSVATQFPAIVVDLPGRVTASGPVTVLFGLCPRCHAEGQQEAA